MRWQSSGHHSDWDTQRYSTRRSQPNQPKLQKVKNCRVQMVEGGIRVWETFISPKAYLAALACGRSRGCHVRETREKESLREREMVAKNGLACPESKYFDKSVCVYPFRLWILFVDNLFTSFVWLNLVSRTGARRGSDRPFRNQNRIKTVKK